MRKSAFVKLDWQQYQHHQRLKRYIEAMPRKLMCQACGGAGQVEDDCINLGFYEVYHIYSNCGWCEGIGYVTPWVRGLWLRYKRTESVRR
jgi:hypothetical protein